MHKYKYYLNRFWEWLISSVGVVGILALVIYVGTSAAQSIYKSYTAQKETKDLQNKLDSSVLEKQRLESLLVYYQTDAFKEVELRRALLMKNPGEKVYALPESSEISSMVESVETTVGEQSKIIEAQKGKPNYRQWYEYLFK